MKNVVNILQADGYGSRDENIDRNDFNFPEWEKIGKYVFEWGLAANETFVS